MADPAHYITAKIASAIGGFFGGATMMTFIKPKTISEAFIRGGVSTGSGIIFSDPIIRYFELAINWENQLMIGAIVGFLAYSILGAIANFFQKNQKEDIFELINKAKERKK
jgi:hypothetical protein